MVTLAFGKKKASDKTKGMGECPTCGSAVPLDADECPECGEIFAMGDLKLGPGDEVVEKGGRREKILFYLGIILILVGGPGVALGSYMHDWFKIPLPGPEYDAYEVFGPINRLVAVLGLIILVIGIIFLIFSLRASKVVTEDDYEVGIERGEVSR